MSDYETTADLNEAIYYERLDVDRLQAQYEAEGNAAHKRQRQVEALLELGNLSAATELCSHGYVGLLTGSCSEGDERYGQEGYRCYDCGAVVTESGGTVLEVK